MSAAKLMPTRPPIAVPAAAKASPQADESQPLNLRNFSPRALIDLLFSKAGASLSRAELLAIVRGGAQFAQDAAGNGARVAEGLGCLVVNDGEAESRSGNFQDGESVAVLMWHMQAQMQAIEGMSSAVGWAASELASRGVE